jgi:hypothetical protein
VAPVAVAEQTYGQSVPAFCQVPVLSQVCGCRPLQVVLLGEQDPEHVPPLQALVVHGEPLSCQVPVSSQSWGWLPLHCLVLGGQAPEQAPALHTYGQACPLFAQFPSVPQACG